MLPNPIPPRLCLPTAARSHQGWQRCDFCHRPVPSPRKPSAGGPRELPSLGGQGGLGQHRLRRHQVLLMPPPLGAPSPGLRTEQHLGGREGREKEKRKKKRDGSERKKKKKVNLFFFFFFARRARSALEAAIINEARSRDLGKWTGNQCLLIGHRRGRRQGGGRRFSCPGRPGWRRGGRRQVPPGAGVPPVCHHEGELSGGRSFICLRAAGRVSPRCFLCIRV